MSDKSEKSKSEATEPEATEPAVTVDEATGRPVADGDEATGEVTGPPAVEDEPGSN
jgi:hypothetical protein